MFKVCDHLFTTLAEAIAYADFLAETCNEFVCVEEVEI
jgi:hypothetical protein